MAKHGGADTFTVKYQVSDGYVGKDRPQSFRIGTGDLSADMTDSEIEAVLDDMALNDMLEKVSAEVDNRDEFIAWARAKIADMKG